MPIIRPMAIRNPVLPPLTKNKKNLDKKITNKNSALKNLPLHHSVPIISTSAARIYKTPQKSQFSRKLGTNKSHEKSCFQKNIGKNHQRNSLQDGTERNFFLASKKEAKKEPSTQGINQRLPVHKKRVLLIREPTSAPHSVRNMPVQLVRVKQALQAMQSMSPLSNSNGDNSGIKQRDNSEPTNSLSLARMADSRGYDSFKGSFSTSRMGDSRPSLTPRLVSSSLIQDCEGVTRLSHASQFRNKREFLRSRTSGSGRTIFIKAPTNTNNAAKNFIEPTSASQQQHRPKEGISDGRFSEKNAI